MAHVLYLLRHGETEWSATGRHTGRTDIPLTGAGREQARAAATTLAALRGDAAPALVLTSPRRRALHTAELAGLRVTETTEDLAEWDYGEYEGITTADIRRTVPGWTVWTHPSPGGEGPEQVADRADRVLDRVAATLPEGDVVLVGHGHFGRVLVARWLGLPPGAGVHFGLAPASVSALGHERGRPQLRHLNVPPPFRTQPSRRGQP
ncbi:probable phosphoglycerate mutase [Amycolatopsis arida]|uniref:Probable phosphoglycerate mutase n=1 Tax=Amycolatopsis arida TaxID=587909 RepID=A0A1I5PHD9_9PSEU|nr:acid phosphatase [Amycolatopsis arida]TDX98496.1 putative phosphoglycerate mutase [Amycolatopsis arida]SFP33267.1 probable phosphoglycerate mutase [Amycolatopsis arida]